MIAGINSNISVKQRLTIRIFSDIDTKKSDTVTQKQAKSSTKKMLTKNKEKLDRVGCLNLGKKILGGPKSLGFCNSLQKNPDELFGPP